MRVYLTKDLLHANKSNAEENRKLLAEKGTLMVNVIGSPGCGKTTLIQRTLQAFSGYRVSIIVGDLYTSEDAEKLTPWCEKVLQINTEGACHLEAGHIGHIMAKENLLASDLLFIENIGNLVCPAAFDLGEDFRVTLLSVAEGNDKPRKYPRPFQSSAAALVTKTDLLPYCTFDMKTATGDLQTINPDLEVFQVSCTSGEGLDSWYKWLDGKLQAKIKRALG
jgi:hydrogenase nickel incorporation protein HypB